MTHHYVRSCIIQRSDLCHGSEDVIKVVPSYGIVNNLSSLKKERTMAEITTSSEKRGSGLRRLVKKRSTRTDMTPMVDLAFLLLAFFILTTTFQKTSVMPVTMPDPEGGSSPVSASNVLNLALTENDKIFWWMGSDETPIATDYSKSGVRQVLLERLNENSSLIVLIKPHHKSRFQNVVDILDEMDIVKVQRYAIVDFTHEDETLLAAI